MKFTLLEKPKADVRGKPDDPKHFSLNIYLPRIEMGLDTKPDNIALLMVSLEKAITEAINTTNDKEVDIADISDSG